MKEVLVVAGDARIPRRAASEAMSLKSVQVMGQQNKQIKKVLNMVQVSIALLHVKI